MILLFIFLIIFPSVALAAPDQVTKSIFDVVPDTTDCMNMQVPLACPKPSPPYVGVLLRYWEPSLIVETVPHPGQSVFRETKIVVDQVAQKSAQMEMSWATNTKDVKVSGGNGSLSMDEGGMSFREAHVYDFPLKAIMSTALCPSSLSAVIIPRYLSEADSPQWRMGMLEKRLAYWIGNWGPLYPRIGFMIQPNPSIQSALTTARAISIASDGIAAGHVVETPLDFSMNMFTDKMQMVFPQKSQCLSIGQEARTWEQGKISKDGKYAWLYWRYRVCCK